MNNNGSVTVKIQDGCSQNCSYCLVRKLRGKSISYSFEDIYNDIATFSRFKHSRKIYICGINTLEYEHESCGDLILLMQRLIKAFPSYLFELDNINPFNIDKVFEIINLISTNPDHITNKVCISIQSVSDRLLRAMHRPYTQESLRKIFTYAKEKEVELTTEIIIGFPGETEEDFQETYEFLEEFGCDFVAHVFSPRPETEAISLPDQISEEVIKDRLDKYKILKKRLGYDY